MNFKTGNNVIILPGKYEIITFDGEAWAHTEKFIESITPSQGVLMQYVDYPEDLWNVLAYSISNEDYIVMAVPEDRLKKEKKWLFR